MLRSRDCKTSQNQHSTSCGSADNIKRIKYNQNDTPQYGTKDKYFNMSKKHIKKNKLPVCLLLIKY